MELVRLSDTRVCCTTIEFGAALFEELQNSKVAYI